MGLGLMGLMTSHAQQFAWSSYTGNPAGGSGFVDGVGSGARFSYPNSVAVDASGIVYVADTGNNTIRKLVYSGTTCTVTTLAGTPGVTGTADGIKGAAQFNNPSGIAVDAAGNLYVADTGNFTIRKINISSGQVTTLAGSPGQTGVGDGPGGLFGSPIGIAVDASGTVYVADSCNHTIRMITAGGVVSTVAGSPSTRGYADGTGSAASFDTPGGLAVDGSGNLFVADTLNNTIRKVTSGGVVTTFAGSPGVYGAFDGTGTGATFNLPGSVAVDGAGNVYVADTFNNALRKITPGGVVTTLAGTVCTMGHSNGVGAAALFNFPGGIAVTSNGTVYVADTRNHTIRKEIWQVVTTAAGSPPDFGTNPGVGEGYTLALDSSAFNGATGLAADDNGNLYIADTQNQIIMQRNNSGGSTTLAGAVMIGSQDGSAWPSWALFDYPEGVAVDSGTNLYVTDTFNNSIRKVSLISGTWTTTTICGTYVNKGNVDGSGSNAMFNNPIGIAVDSGTNLYVADTYNSTIRQLTSSGSTWTARTIAGSPSVNGTSDGTGSAALFAYPNGIAVDSGTNVYVVDSGNYTIRMLTLSGSSWTSKTIAGTPGVTGTADGVGVAAQFGYPTMVAVDKVGTLFVADTGNSTIRMIINTGSNWVVSTIGGTSGVNGGVSGNGNNTVSGYEGIGTQALFSAPKGIAVKTSPNGTDLIYVMDSGNNRVMVGSYYMSTQAASSVTGTSMTFNALLNPNGMATSYYFQYGYNIAYGATTGTQSIGSGTGFQSVTTTLTGLFPNTNYDYRLVVINSSGTYYGTNQVVITPPIVVPSITSATTITGTTGYPMSYTLTANNAPSGFGVSSLPPGLSFNPLTGVITGTPTVTASTAVILSATNVIGTGTANGSFNIVKLSLPVFSSSGTASGIYGGLFNYTITANNNVTSYSATGLPAGLTLNSATGLISGTPTTIGTSSVTLGAINSSGTSTMALILKLAPPYVWSNFAGLPMVNGTANGTGTTSRFYYPQGVAVDSGSNIYVADTNNRTVRMITPSGVVSTLAGNMRVSGSANGTGTNALFNTLSGIAVDSGSNVYVADRGCQLIRMITPAGVVSTLAGQSGVSGTANGTGTNAQFYNPFGLAVDSGSNVYVAEYGNNMIRKITPTGTVTTLAGSTTSGTANGTGAAAQFYQPTGVAVDSGSNVYVVDYANQTIRKITPGGVVTTVAGIFGTTGTSDGVGSNAQFCYPRGIAVDSGTNLYVADYLNQAIRKITQSNGVWSVMTIGGSQVSGTSDGVGTNAQFYYPLAIAVNGSGNLFVADYYNQRISQGVVMQQAPTITSTLTAAGVNMASINYTITASNGAMSYSASGLPPGLTLDSSSGVISGIASMAGTYSVTLGVTNLFGSSSATLSLTVMPPPFLYAWSNFVGTPTLSGSVNGTGSNALFSNVDSVAVDSGSNVYVADTTGNNTIRKVTPGGVVTTLAGRIGVTGSANGTGTNALFNSPSGVAVDSGSNVYVADTGNNMIRKITPTGTVSNLAGSGSAGLVNGIGSTARFSSPSGVAVDSGSNVYVADTVNNVIRMITPGGVVSTLAGSGVSGTLNGTGTAAQFGYPKAVAVDSGSNVYVVDETNGLIRKVTPGGVVTTIAGIAGSYGSQDGVGSSAQFYFPTGIAVDSGTNLYVTDQWNQTIRRITLSSGTWTVSTIGSISGSTGSIDGLGGNARFYQPNGIASSSNGTLFVADMYNYRVSQGTLVNAPVITSALTATGTDGFLFNYSITAGNYITGYSVTGLGGGLSLNPATGLISGTPNISGTFSLGISASNPMGTGSATLLITLQSGYQTWQASVFSVGQLSSSAISSDLATPAGDGISNLMKYALHLNPLTNGVSGLPVESIVNISGNNYLTLAYTKVIVATDLTYTVQISTDLQTWNSGPGYTTTTSTINNGDGVTQTVTVQSLVPLNGTSKQFIRLQVSH